MKNYSYSLILIFSFFFHTSYSQKLISFYSPLKKDRIRIGTGTKDFLPFIQKGYTLMLPEQETTKGVLILLEDSKYDDKNRSAKQLYNIASKNGFAVLSISTEIPLDFYFSKKSILSTHTLISEVFTKYNLPNTNIFFLGTSLVGHRAMRYIQFIKEHQLKFKLNIKGIVICNFTLDWTRKWHQHERTVKIKRKNPWEAKFINYMLETNLGGSPKTASESYHNFSPYSYFDEKSRNIVTYKNYAIRAYIEPAIKYRLKKYANTLYENNATDIVGFLSELSLIGNENTELIVFQTDDNVISKKNAQTTWNSIDKEELMNWVLRQVNTK